MHLLGIILLLIVLAVYLFMHSPSFGAPLLRERLKKNQDSPNYRHNQFQNKSHTPALSEGSSFLKVLRLFLFDNKAQKIPPVSLPSKKTDLLHLDPGKNMLVWFGHSSYFMQISGKTFLIDPVFSGNASPIRFTTKSFKGTDIYAVKDLPTIDYLMITHDHWDHLDYKTVLQLKPIVRKVITGLGVSDHLESWGYDRKNILEMDWNEQLILTEGFKINSVPARHFSGRGFKRNRTIWISLVLTTPQKKIFIGGDSGYDRHFAETGNQFGPFDLVILENGQYNENWKYIHMTPEETVQAAIDLQAKKLLPVHWAKFSLSLHAWNEPIIRIKKEAGLKNISLLHPKIGEEVDLDGNMEFDPWWEEIH